MFRSFALTLAKFGIPRVNRRRQSSQPVHDYVVQLTLELMEDANITTVFQRFSPANFPFPGDAGDDGLACPQQAAAMVNTREIPPEAILLGVYLELQNGWFSTTLT